MDNAKHRRIALPLLLAALGLGCAAPAASDEGFEAFRSSLDRETFEGGVYLFDGDLPVESLKRLREVYTVRGWVGAGAWGPSERHQLRYCVSDTFGRDHARVVQAMGAATAMWESAADVDFHYLPSEDARCDVSNDTVVFDVRPVEGQPYGARAFFPNTGRDHRNVLVNLDALGVDSTTLDKVLEHQLGHTLGLDHTRLGVALGGCGPDEPVCSDPARTEMTDTDRSRARQIYGAPGESRRAATTGELVRRTETGLVAAGARVTLAPIAVEAGSRLRVDLHGTGDLDLYVRFDDAPSRHNWDCRPFGPDATERCEMSVPEGAHDAFVTVHNAADASAESLSVEDYVVDIQHTVPPAATLNIPRVELEFVPRI